MKKKNIIFNADDYGREIQINAAIQEAIKKGFVTDVSIMTTCHEGYQNLIEQGGFDIIDYKGGIHLCLTLGKPLSKKILTTKLVDNEGGFRDKSNCVLHVKNNKKAIEEEFCVQIEKLKEVSDFKVTHLDSHQHIHFDINILPIAVSLCKRYGIPCMRIPSYSKDLSLKSKMGTLLKIAYIKIRGIKVVDFFGSPSQIKGVSNRNYSTFELMCHPWYNSEGKIVNKVAIHEADNCNLLESDLAPFLHENKIKYNDIIENKLQ